MGGTSLLNIPPCSMVEEPSEQAQSLFRPPMSDPELDLERQQGARPKVAGPLTTQTIQEEARAAPTEKRAFEVRGTDFYLPLRGQPWISKRKSWRAPIVTEQGNPGIYVQIDEWLPLYKGNIYVVDEVTGRMYLSKGEYLMRIAETASHRPFQDHELSISRHVPEKEYLDPQGQLVRGQWETGHDREREGNVEAFTPIPRATGDIGRTPVPVAESTRQPVGGMLTETPVGGGLGYGDIPSEPEREGGGTAEETHEAQGLERPEWALPEPTEPCRPPSDDVGRAEGQEREHISQEYTTPQQRLVEADKRHKKRLATLARDHIIKLREERQNLAQGWLNEYLERAISVRLQGKSLGVLRTEYINRYNRLLDRERQPHSDFFVNLTPDVEEELDFAEEELFRLNEYVSHYAWDEAEYMKLRFIAARHYASRGHWDDAYAYILRTRPDDTSQHEDTYNRNGPSMALYQCKDK